MLDLHQIANQVEEEVKKAVVGKDEIVEKIMLAIVAGGHILIEDTPGVGKTTMAIAFSKAMALDEKRVQFTPDVMPSDITGFSMYKKETGEFEYQPGAVMCNLFLADEINRTSPKTQSSLLEVMEEGKVTVDGVTREIGRPFIVFATENPEGSAGTQLLPESQLDRFMICISMGFPTVKEEMEILRRRQKGAVTNPVNQVADADMVIAMQEEVSNVYVHDVILQYISYLSKATRENEMFASGMSPRGSVALAAMARASAWLDGREYVLPQDVKKVFVDVAGHRVRLNTKAKVAHVSVDDVLEQILAQVKEPNVRKK